MPRNTAFLPGHSNQSSGSLPGLVDIRCARTSTQIFEHFEEATIGGEVRKKLRPGRSIELRSWLEQQPYPGTQLGRSLYR